MRRPWRLLGAAVLAISTLSATGCYHVTVRSGKTPSGVTEEKKAHMFIFGLVGAEVNPSSSCDPAIVETQEGVVDWLLTLLTAGIYTPYTVTITCAATGGGGGGGAAGGH